MKTTFTYTLKEFTDAVQANEVRGAVVFDSESAIFIDDSDKYINRVADNAGLRPDVYQERVLQGAFVPADTIKTYMQNCWGYKADGGFVRASDLFQ